MRQELAHLCRLARYAKVVSGPADVPIQRPPSVFDLTGHSAKRRIASARPATVLSMPILDHLVGAVIRIPPPHFRPLRRRTCRQ
jgi:hypothetical protein